mgnify:CR=1 FL=1
MVELEQAHLPQMVSFMVTQLVLCKLLQQQTWEVLAQVLMLQHHSKCLQ